MDASGELTPAGSDRQRAERLDVWIAQYGPLSVPAALLLTLDICAQAATMTRGERRGALASLRPSSITRAHGGGWQWDPFQRPRRRSGADDDAVARLGRVLFHALTSEEIDEDASPDVISERLRRARRDVPADVVELTRDAIAMTHGRDRSLATFARDVTFLLGVGRARHRPRRRLVTLALVITALIVVTSGALHIRDSNASLSTRRLSSDELVEYDVGRETAETFALMDEHTAAIQYHGLIGRLLRARLELNDPRLAWEAAQEAWVRALAGDWLTSEQGLSDLPGWLSKELGEQHPYTSSVRVSLATALEARGAMAEAASLRDAAERATRELLGPDGYRGMSGQTGPPGAIAHVAPNAPEREGFRRTPAGAYFIPLTSSQRRLAGEKGWQLHLLARRPCRVSVVIGAHPKRLDVDMFAGPDGRWQVGFHGATPDHLEAAASESVRVSILADPAGRLDAHVGDGPVTPLSHAISSDPPIPPYGLTFDAGSHPEACAVVWLQVQVPPGVSAATASSTR